MKNLPVFVSLSILLAGFGLFFSSSTAQAAPGDVEQTVSVGGNYVRHLVRIGDYIYVSNFDTAASVYRITKINKNTGAVISHFNTCANMFGAVYDLETDGTYLWINENATVFSGACDPFSRPGGYSAYGFTKMDPSNGNILQRVWFTGQSKSSAYDGQGYLWAGVGNKLCKVPTSGTDRADNCFTYIGVGGWGQITESDGVNIYVNGIASGLPAASYIVYVRQSDGAVVGSVYFEGEASYRSVLLKGSEVWRTGTNSGLWKVNVPPMTGQGPYPHNISQVTGNGWGQHNIATEGSCLWVGGPGQAGSLEETLSVLDSSGTFIKKINVDPGTGNNKLYDVLYDAAAQKMWVSAEDLGKVYRLNASGCPSANTAPNVPTRVYPPDGSWIKDTNPITFTVNVSDPDGNQVKACFDLDANGTCDYWSSLVASGSGVSWQTSINDTAGRFWQAKAQDAGGLESGWPSLPWTVKKDTAIPSATLDQEKGISTDTSIWVLLSESDALSGVAVGDVDLRINGGSWTHYADTINDFTYTGSNGNTYEFRYRVQDVAGNWSNFSYDGSVTIQTTGTINGYVWDDTNTLTPACTFTAGSDAKMSGRTVTATGPSSGSGVTDLNGNYSISGLTAGSYSVCVDLPLPTSEWKKICPTDDGTLCESPVTVTAGATTPLNFGLKYEVVSWFQAVWPVGSSSGDIHSNGSISIAVPTGKFLLSGEGVVSVGAGETISTGSGGASESLWDLEPYGNISWPTSLINSVTATDTSKTVKVYKIDDLVLTVDTSTAWVFTNDPKIIVANDIIIMGDVDTEQINAILIAKGDFTVQPLDTPSNQPLKIKGAVYANEVIVNRTLINNSEPVMKIEFDPRYFVYTNTPYFTQATHTWEEVR